jgi:hypothetical protein
MAMKDHLTEGAMSERTEYGAEALQEEAGIADPSRWRQLASPADVDATVAALRDHGFLVQVVPSGDAALDAIKALIPAGAQVMNGSSETLAEIGYTKLLDSGEHPWVSLWKAIRAESDPAKRMELRRQSILADWFLASCGAVAKSGEIIAADRSGSRVGAFPFAARNLLIVAGTHKIVPTVNDGLARIHDYAFPLEDLHMKRLYKSSSAVSKIVILARELIPKRTHVILVEEALGY